MYFLVIFVRKICSINFIHKNCKHQISQLHNLLEDVFSDVFCNIMECNPKY